MTLRLRSDAKLAYLLITVDRHVTKIALTPVCVQGTCLDDPNAFQANPDPPVPWTEGTPYSQTLTV
jgi:hypothetical protein